MKLCSSSSFRALTGALPLIALGGCGGGSSSSRPTTPTALNSIAFVSTRDGAEEIYVMNPDGSGQTRVTNGVRSAGSPSQSRNGRIAFQSNRDGNFEIYSINRNGSELRRLTTDVGTAAPFDGEPAFSPDGSTIAWTSMRGGTSNIWVMDSSGTNQRQLITTHASTQSPTWTPDGKSIAYFSTALLPPETSG